MPSTTDNNDRGFLFITFDVEFPRGEISAEDKVAIRALLKQDDVKPKPYNGLRGY